jgi:predicted Zn-dependent protease
MNRILVVTLTILGGCALAFAQNELAIPSDYAIDLQLAASSRVGLMGGSSEIVGTPSNYLGDAVFKSLLNAGANQPFPWKLTLVGNNTVNAGSTAGGQIYVDGGMLPLITDNKGLWAAVLSHEVSHTSRRHQVITYNRMVFNQRMIEYYRRRIDAGDKSATWGLLAFRVAAPIALKKLERNQEHEADVQGMLLMARAGSIRIMFSPYIIY